MRIGLLANTFDPLFGEMAGGHVHFLEVAKRWVHDDVWVFAPKIAETTIRRELPNATFVPTFDGSFIRNYQIRNLLRTALSVRRWAQLRSCDVLLATSHFFPDVVPATFARQHRTVVCIQHILRPARERPGPFLPNLISQVFQSISFALVRRFARAVLVNTLETSRIIRLDPKRTKSYIMTHGVYHEDPALIEGRPKVPSGVYLGRLVPTKGVDDLLRAWRLVCDEIPNATLQIVGGGEDRYERSLRELAGALGLSDSVHFTGRVADDVKRRALKSAAIFVFPSKEEGWGIAIGEAMAYGLPCVVYNLPAYRDVFVKGCLTAPLGDVSALAGHIVSLFRDTETAGRLSKEASELSETFSWDRAALIERRALQELNS